MALPVDPDIAARAAQGDADAQCKVGLHHICGDTPNPLKARAFFAAAALQGHRQSQINLGLLLAEQGGSANDARAVRLFAQAAAQYDARGAYSLAVMKQRGRGTPVDLAGAAALFRDAAAQNYLPAINAYAGCLYNGLGVDKDEKAALALFWQAATGGSETAQDNVRRFMGDTMHEAAKTTAHLRQAFTPPVAPSP